LRWAKCRAGKRRTPCSSVPSSGTTDSCCDHGLWARTGANCRLACFGDMTAADPQLSKASPEQHYVNRTGWLRAAVLGANDGLLSVSSLLVGVSAASFDRSQLLLTGVAGIVAGAMSMAAGEYVSVSSQADSEAADIERERRELKANPKHEYRELTAIYIRRGLPKDLALQVARALSEHDRLEAHARDELGITEHSTAKPVQAAFASAASFIAGGLAPLLTILLAPAGIALPALVIVTILVLSALGAAGAKAGGAPLGPGAIRVVLWGSLAMAITFAAGRLFHASV
jgi:VIT1/CCC1 family predicted Fe2+/Mn2+ transporter